MNESFSVPVQSGAYSGELFFPTGSNGYMFYRPILQIQQDWAKEKQKGERVSHETAKKEASQARLRKRLQKRLRNKSG